MRTNLYSDEELKEIEKNELDLDTFDDLVPEHEFSEVYKRRKKRLLSALQMYESKNSSPRRVGQVAAAFGICFLVLTGTVYAAGKIWSVSVSDNGNYQSHMTVTKQNEETKMSKEITKDIPEDAEMVFDTPEGTLYAPPTFYKLTPTYLPENCGRLESWYGPGQYGNLKNRDSEDLHLTFSLFDYEPEENIEIPLTDVIEKRTFSGDGYEAYIFQKSEVYALDKEVYVYNNTDGYILHIYAGTGICDAELKKIVDGIQLEPAADDNGQDTIAMCRYSKSMFAYTDEKEAAADMEELQRDTVAAVGANGIGQTVSEWWGTVRYDYTVDKMEVFDSIAHLNPKDFRSEWFEGYTDDKGNLIPFQRTEVCWEDGVNKMSHYGETKEVKKKFVYLTMTCHNPTDEVKELCVAAPSLGYAEMKDGKLVWDYRDFEFADRHKRCEFSEVVYFDSSKYKNSSSSFYFMDVKPGDNTYHIGFLVDEDRLDEIYLEIGHQAGAMHYVNLNK